MNESLEIANSAIHNISQDAFIRDDSQVP